MSGATFFDRLDQDELRRVVLPLGTQFAFATSTVTEAMLDDDTISPTALIAGIVKAHALGVASALFGAVAAANGNRTQLQFLQAEMLDAAIATIRAEMVAPGVTDGTVQ